MYWYEDKNGAERDVFVSSRVRLARNLADYPFAPVLEKTGAGEIIERVSTALCENEGYTVTDFSALAENEKVSLVEKHLASPEMIKNSLPSAIVENRGKGVSVLVGEEDHVRIQSIGAGLCLEGCLEAALEAEELIDRREKIAFSKELGYLTHCPTNLGTGMRASVMMFLPLLTMTKRIGALENTLQKIGLTVRGTVGEGSASKGCLYQISNRVSLGVSEEEIIKNLTDAAEEIAEAERALRKKLASGEDVSLEDRIMRSVGIMKYARSVDTEELYRLYSDVRLGVSVGYVKGTCEAELDRLLVECLPATLSISSGRALSAKERDRARAQKLRAFGAE